MFIIDMAHIFCLLPLYEKEHYTYDTTENATDAPTDITTKNKLQIKLQDIISNTVKLVLEKLQSENCFDLQRHLIFNNKEEFLFRNEVDRKLYTTLTDC